MYQVIFNYSGTIVTSATRILLVTSQIPVAQVSQECFPVSLKFLWHQCHKNLFKHLSNLRGTSVTKLIFNLLKIPMAHVSQQCFLVTFKFPCHKCHKIFFSRISQILWSHLSQVLQGILFPNCTQDAINYLKTHPNLT